MYNNSFGSSVAPAQAFVTAFPELAWDTFGTIGLAVQPGTGGLITQAPSTGFPNAIFEGTGGSSNNFSFAAGGQPAFSQIDASGRVLLAQFTVHAGEHIRGTIGSVAGFEETGLAGLTTFSENGGTFNSVPAPGALALLGLAGLVGSRRRRA
jgi:MYXO-CTERM domain-containing protein